MDKSIDLEELQAGIREVFGDQSGQITLHSDSDLGAGLDPDAQHGAAAPSLDYCTLNSTPVPDFTGQDQPIGLCHTELVVTQYADQTGKFHIVERDSGFRGYKKRKRRISTHKGVVRKDYMDPETLRRSVARAKRKFREACSMLQVDRIATGTFRDNVSDFQTALWVHETFVRLYKSLLPYSFQVGNKNVTVKTFDYACVPERQKRGAWHFHYALNQPHDVIKWRWAWQEAQRHCKLAHHDGNIDIRYKPQKAAHHGSVRVGRYLSKYLTKQFDEGLTYKKRYFTSRGIPEPEQSRMFFLTAHTTDDLLEFVEKLMGVRITYQSWGKAGPADILHGSFEPT